jgi:MazG family protein
MDDSITSLGRLQGIIQRLRGPNGCPWDRAQTLAAMAPCVVEETAELVDAIEDAAGSASGAVRDELGDLLMNVFLCAQIAADEGKFTLAEVAAGVCDKLVRRHPHVFGEARVESVEHVLEQWNAIKRDERKSKEGAPTASRLDSVPRSLPALERAYELGRLAARAGLDWPDVQGVLDKVREEIAEVERSLAPSEACESAPEAELGDLLFSVVNLCRKLEVRPEEALRRSLKEFTRRFQYLEARVERMEDATLEELEVVWIEAKKASRQASGGR